MDKVVSSKTSQVGEAIHLDEDNKREHLENVQVERLDISDIPEVSQHVTLKTWIVIMASDNATSIPKDRMINNDHRYCPRREYPYLWSQKYIIMLTTL